MKTIVISCLFNLPNRTTQGKNGYTDKGFEWYLNNTKELLTKTYNDNQDIVIFTDQSYILDLLNYNPRALFISVDLNFNYDFKPERIIKYGLENSKYSPEYLTMTHAKYEFIAQTINELNVDYVYWCDGPYQKLPNKTDKVTIESDCSPFPKINNIHGPSNKFIKLIKIQQNDRDNVEGLRILRTVLFNQDIADVKLIKSEKLCKHNLEKLREWGYIGLYDKFNILFKNIISS